jgi:hypothetical protein
MWRSDGEREPVWVAEGMAFDLNDQTRTISINIYPSPRNPRNPYHVRAGRFEDADLIVSLEHTNPPDREARNGPDSRYDWSYTFEAPGGGIMATNDPYPYRAPADGYQSACRVAMRHDDPNWGTDMPVKLYLKTRSPTTVYCSIAGGVDYRVRSLHGGGGSFRCIVNPSGSRNLEPP